MDILTLKEIQAINPPLYLTNVRRMAQVTYTARQAESDAIKNKARIAKWGPLKASLRTLRQATTNVLRWA